MTQGFNVVLNPPYEGAVIKEYKTKKGALEAYNETLKELDEDKLNGIALVYLEIIKEKGDWRLNESS